ncbi:PH domain-containing protein [Cellulomonas sp. P5_E12]
MRQYRVRLEADGQGVKVVNFFGSHTFVWVEVRHAPSTRAHGDVRSQVADTVRRRESKALRRASADDGEPLICTSAIADPSAPTRFEPIR